MSEVIKHDLEIPVTVRKYSVNIIELRSLLRDSKKLNGVTNRQISEKLNRPITEVEHWFRLDDCFSVPSAEIWHDLKEVIKIDSEKYDDQVTEFIEKPNVFEKAGRFYEINGIAPTLTATSADEKIIIRGEEIGMNNAILTQKEYEKKSFTYASIFAGIGGMTMGLEQVGGKGVIAWEYDPTEKRRQYAQDAHKLLHPEILVHGDVCEANTDEIPDFDVLAFTPPCQSFSVAGKRGGFDDTRGTLTFEALRIAKAKKPKILFMENVKGLVNHDGGSTLSTIIHAINEIGYTVDFTVLNSKYFDVAQNRERIYLIAVRDDLITPEPWNDVKGSLMLPKAKRRYQEEGVKSFNFEWPEQTEVRTRLRDFLEDSVDERYYLSEDKTAKLVAQLEAKDLKVGAVASHPFSKKFEFNGFNNDTYSPAMIATDYKAPKCLLEEGLPIREATKQGFTVAAVGDAVNIQFPNSKTRRGRVGKQMANTIEASGINQGVVERVGNVNPSGNGMNGNVYSIDAGLSPTLTTNKGEGVKVLEDSPIMLGHIDLKGHDANKRVYSPTGQRPTLTTMGGGHREPKIAEEVRAVLTPERLEKRQNGRRFKDDGEESFTSIDRHGVALGKYPKYRIRKLTPKECLRLQSIPPHHIDALLTEFSDSRCYKFAGNGLTTNVITALGERLIKYL